MKLQSLTSQSIIVLQIFISICFSLSSSRNPNKFLKVGSYQSVEDDSDLLSSADNTFTSGFYSVGENAYCFSIWFTNSKEKTVVWMANRDQPVNGKGSRISMLGDGDFVLTDVDGSIRWQTNTGTLDVQKAELLDNGNLVLKNSNGKVLWQSFDFPTDTLLPDQLFTKSMKLIFRLGSPNNYAAGYYSFFFDNDNVLKLKYDGPDVSSLYWPDVNKQMFENGRYTYNSTRIAFFDDMGRFSASDRLKFKASDLGFGIKRRLTIDYDGNLRLYSLNNEGLWNITWEALAQLCLVHGICGKNGICVYTPIPHCSCLPGFEMADPNNWNKGCEPRFNTTCSPSHLKFVKIPHMNFFGHDSGLYSFTNKTLDWCKNACMNDCLCVGFNYRLTGEAKCHLKLALFNGVKSPKLKVSTYLKLPLSIETSEAIILHGINLTCSLGKAEPVVNFSSFYGVQGKRVRWAYLYWFAFAIGAIEIIFIVSGLWLLFKTRDVPTEVEEGYRVITCLFKRFSCSELKKATKNFKDELGKGASGAVFKGVLADKKVVAVKKLEVVSQTEEVFWAEVSIIGKINHMNLVRMWGFCSESRHRLLVYEYVENKSLDKHLFSENVLRWKERFKVGLGTAKGLAYLHHECLEWIIHCDVKPENILLDGEFEPKISDFGLAKLSQRSYKDSEFSGIRGTKGYMAPEWALNLPITAKVDVYSYGVVILELVTGIRLSNWVMVDGEEQETEFTRFIKVFKRKFRSDEDAAWIDEAVDTRLNGEFSRSQAAKMVEIGIACVEEDRNKRPTMDSVVQALLECEDGVKVPNTFQNGSRTSAFQN